MSDLSITISVSAIIAVIIGELIGILWYTDASPWGRRLVARHTVPALLCNIGLVFILEYIMKHCWAVSKWEDAAYIGLWVALLYFALEAPHVRWSGREFSRFMFHVGHKFALIFSMTMALWHFKDMKQFHFKA